MNNEPREPPQIREEDWAGLGFTPRVGFGARPGLVIVDTLLGFTDTASPCGANVDLVVESMAELLAAARRGAIPVVFTTLSYDDGEQLAADVFLTKVPVARNIKPGGRWAEIDPRLAPLESEPILHKLWPSAFVGTTLGARLAALGVDTLIVAGLSTSGCVRATAQDGLHYGYRVIVPEEAVGDPNASAHRSNLLDIDAKYGDVAAVSDVIRHISSIAAAA
jgi:maleamate amidohydrolase